MNVFSTIGVTLAVLAWLDLGGTYPWAAAFFAIGVLVKAAFQK